MSSNGNDENRRSLSRVCLEARRACRFALLLGEIVLLGGCIMLPLPASEKLLAGKPVTQEQLAFLVPQVTTKQEVIERLGSPNYIWEDARLFVYNWEMRQGILLWAFGMYGGGDAGASHIQRFHLFLVQFDEQDRAQRWEATVRPFPQSLPDFLRQWVKNTPTSPGNSSGKPQ